MDINDLKLELTTLQKLDTKEALKNNIMDKKEWLKTCLNMKQDKIAASIIEIGERYNISCTTLAKLFDDTMLIRVLKELKRNNKVKAK